VTACSGTLCSSDNFIINIDDTLDYILQVGKKYLSFISVLIILIGYYKYSDLVYAIFFKSCY